MYIAAGTAFAMLVLLAVVILLSRNASGWLGLILIAAGVLAGLGFLISIGVLVSMALAQALDHQEGVKRRCPKCGRNGALSDTGKSEFRGGESGVYRERQCGICGHRIWRFEAIGSGGEDAYGYDPSDAGCLR